MLIKNNWFKSRWLSWLNKRIPPSQSVQLSQRQIFIFLTRNGWMASGVLLVLFLGAVNYGNSLILGMAFWLTAIFLVSIFHTYRNLAGLTIDALRVQSCCAGERARFYINLSRPENGQQHLALLLTWGGVQQFSELTNQLSTTVCMALPTRQRGCFQPGRLNIASSFPLGLFRAWTWIDLDMACWVYPKPLPSPLPRLQGAGEMTEAQLLNRVLGVDDFEGLQTYAPGDPLKHVHWKVFARTDEMFTKTFVAAHQPQRLLDWSKMPSDHLEVKLSQLCYWILQFAEQHVSFALHLPGEKVALGSGDLHCQRCLIALAQL